MMKKITRFFFLGILITLVGCYDNVDTSKSKSSASLGPVSEITEEHFSGAANATNKVTGIEISWTAATANVQSYRLYRVKGSSLDLIASVGSEVTSLVDGSVTWGAIYSYVVKAVDSKGVEDPNVKRVSSLAWAGLASVVAETATSIKVTFDNSSAVANEIRIYIEPAIGGTRQLVASVSPSDGQYTINDLRPGYKYLVSGQAFVASLNKEDGNTVKWSVPTNTKGFHDNGAELAKWANISSARAFGESPGAPTHPLYAEKSPKGRVVELTFNSFSGVGALQKYVVIRAPEGMTIDTSAVETCSTSTTRSCRPCGVLQGSGSLFCRDSNVAASPARYRYTMAMIHTEGSEEWVETFPQEKVDSFSVLVPIPPQDMVLVQRDAANYEMCTGQMSKYADPKNKNRCLFSGAGSVPYNSGIGKAPLNLDRNQYDFGYNLFVDRYFLACNWTTQANGGKCGPGATDGDCVGSGAIGAVPSNTIGVDNNVMWWSTPRSGTPVGAYTACFIKTAGVWQEVTNLQTKVANYNGLYRTMLTNDPSAGHPKKPISFGSSSAGSEMAACQSFEDANYGRKRLSRVREYRVYTAFPTVPGDPYVMTYSQATTLHNGGRWNATDGYRCANGYGSMNTAPAPNMVPATLNEMVTSPTNEVSAFTDGTTDTGMRVFFQGAVSSVDCMSRYGVNEASSPLWQTASDAFSYDPSTYKLKGIASPLDSGNIDVVTDALGGSSGYIIDGNGFSIGGAGATQYRYVYYSSGAPGYTYFNTALGFPAFMPSSAQYLPKSLFGEHYSSLMQTPYISSASGTYMMHLSGGSGMRWNSRFLEQGVTGGVWRGANRCVLPAE